MSDYLILHVFLEWEILELLCNLFYHTKNISFQLYRVNTTVIQIRVIEL